MHNSTSIKLGLFLGILLLPALASAEAVNVNEREYHAKVFDYAMGALPTGKSYPWKTFESSGIITVGEAFSSKSQSLCRPFTEKFNFSGTTGEIGGYGCRREGRDGWCMLQTNNMLSCALEPSDNLFDEAIEKAAGLIPGPNTPGRINSNGGAGEILGGIAAGTAKALKGGKDIVKETGNAAHSATQSGQRMIENNTPKSGNNDKPWYDGYWPPW